MEFLVLTFWLMAALALSALVILVLAVFWSEFIRLDAYDSMRHKRRTEPNDQ